MVPEYDLPGAVRFNDAIAQGERGNFQAPTFTPTTLPCCSTPAAPPAFQGAVLLHRNIIANTLQAEAWYAPVMRTIPTEQQLTSVCALPLYHIFAFTANMMLSMRTGGKTILIPNPRDLAAVLKSCRPPVSPVFRRQHPVQRFVHPDFSKGGLDPSKVSVGGGMARICAVAKLWLEKPAAPFARATACQAQPGLIPGDLKGIHRHDWRAVPSTLMEADR